MQAASSEGVLTLLDDVPVDSGRPFIPEELTPLFYTPSYRQLSAGQRLRYNQLQGLYFNEQIVFFETVLGRTILDALLRLPLPPGLAAGLRQFREEERQHTEMFLRLNRLCAPHLYGDRELYFIEAPPVWTAISKWAIRRPLWFPLFLWLMLLQEERSLFYSKAYVRQRVSLEPHFVEAHRLHLVDEVGHVRWDEELLDELWRRAHPFLRKVNAKLFAWMVGELFGPPKRAQLRVIAELARELPELREREPEMRRQLLALSRNDAYLTSLYSRGIVPRTFARFDGAPEFRTLKICGYRYHPQPEIVP